MLHRSLILTLFERMVRLYPFQFRQQFSAEVCWVLTERMDEAGAAGRASWWAAVFRETSALGWSICTEHWHERWSTKEVSMTPADPLETEIWANQRRLRLMRLARAGIVLAVLVVLNQACTHTYASVKIAQAKSLGVYPTPEAAAGAMFNRPWEDVPVASLGGVHCDINNPDGDPFVWFCTARVRYEQPPAGYTRTDFLHGSFFFKVEDGWVYMGEHLFIDVISSAMKRFHLEGVE